MRKRTIQRLLSEKERITKRARVTTTRRRNRK